MFIKFAVLASSDPLPPLSHVHEGRLAAATDSCIQLLSYFVINCRICRCIYLLLILLLGKNCTIGGNLLFKFPRCGTKSSIVNGSPKCSSTKREQKSTPIQHCAVLQVNCLFFVRKCWRPRPAHNGSL